MHSHEPVLLDKVIELLAIRPDGCYADCTVGLGGHSREIARRLTGGGRLLAIDADPESIEIARERLKEFGERIQFEHALFSEVGKIRERLGWPKFDGLIADCGVSRYQLTDPARGLSFDSAESLDMRLDRSSSGPTAADIVNFASEQDIAQILRDLGEERRARRVASAIVRARPVRSARILASVIESVVPRTSRFRSSTKSFQALRIYVNRELEELEALLEAIPQVMAAGGRVLIISFHSLEDRRVKTSMREWARRRSAVLALKKPAVPGLEEIRRNPAARSAKLRCAIWQSAG